MAFPTWSILALALSMATIPHTTAQIVETSIWINEIPLYSALAPCASDRMSAIIRAQKSGCNDDSAHTSFACFCIDSSSQFSSIISTAVAEQCSQQAGQETVAGGTANVAVAQAQITAAPARRGAAIIRQVVATPTGDVASALELFESYCAKRTMLSKFGGGPTSTPHAQATITITQPPQTVTVTPSPPSSASSNPAVPIAAILAPALVVALISIIGAWLYVRRSRNRLQRQTSSGHLTNRNQPGAEKEEQTHITELAITEEQKNELSDGERRAYAMHRAELPGGGVVTEGRDGNDGRAGWV